MGFGGPVFLALALNMDALGVGISYGARRIKLPLTSILIISLASMIAISLSMTVGKIIAGYISPFAASRLGGIILLLVGLWVICQYIRQEKFNTNVDTCPSAAQAESDARDLQLVTVMQVRMPGFIIQILKKPHIADMDNSGAISGREAVLLALALAMDSLAAGAAASLLGYGIMVTTFCVGFGQVLLSNIGLAVGNGISCSFIGRQIGRHVPVLSGLVLIFLGMMRLY